MSFSLQWNPTSATDAQILSSTGKCLGSYHWGSERRHPFFHPVYSYGANEPLTCFAPWDHRWHRGLWWSWKYINGINFWEQLAEQGEGEGESVVVEHAANQREDGSIEIRQQIEMRAIQTHACLLTEERRLSLHPLVDGITGGWALDWDLIFRAPIRCELTATPYPEVPWGGYAGLNYRPNRAMGWREALSNSEGQCGREGCHGAPTRWGAYAGNLDGNEHDSFEQPAQAGLAILDHPENPRHPTPFYAASVGPENRDFGFLSPCPLFRENLLLESGEQLRLRYRVIPFDGLIPEAGLEDAWQAYVK